MTKKSYLGSGWAFPPEFNNESDAVSMASQEEDIRESLMILLSTTPGERVHRYDYGCPIRKYAFELMDKTTLALMQDDIEKAVILFEPRIDLNKVTFEKEEQNGILYILLDYTIRQTNRRSNMVYPFYLNEGTDLTL